VIQGRSGRGTRTGRIEPATVTQARKTAQTRGPTRGNRAAQDPRTRFDEPPQVQQTFPYRQVLIEA